MEPRTGPLRLPRKGGELRCREPRATMQRFPPGLLGRVLICGRPAGCKRYFRGRLARSRMLPSVRPLMQRWSCGPVWEFADRNQIINACSRHDEYIWFFQPRLADCCAILSFDRLHL